MCEFDHDSLPELLGMVNASQTQWTKRNWQQSLSAHPPELEELLKMMSVLDIWKIADIPNKVRDKFIPEAFTDLLISVHLACWGLYKYASMCLRSGLATTRRLIYFATHPVEFEWWLAGGTWYREGGTPGQEVWGRGHIYFDMLDGVKSFDSVELGRDVHDADESTARVQLTARVRTSYKQLSQHIHSSAEYFQTEVGHVTPQYNTERFKLWLGDARRVCELMNLLLALGLHDTFSKLGAQDRETIVEKGITTEGDREKLRKMLP